MQEAVAPAAEVAQLREDEAGFPAARAGGGRCQEGQTVMDSGGNGDTTGDGGNGRRSV